MNIPQRVLQDNLAQAATAGQHPGRRGPSLAIALAGLALVAAAPTARADCKCTPCWIVEGDDRCVLTEDCTVERLTIRPGGMLWTGPYTLTISSAFGLTILPGGVLIVGEPEPGDAPAASESGAVVLRGGGWTVLLGSIVLPDSSATLRIADNDHVLFGSGTVFGTDDGAGIEIGDGRTLVSSVTIEGNCQIRRAEGASRTTFVNNGRVHANNAGTLDIAVDSLGSPNGDWLVTTNGSAVLEFRVGCTTMTRTSDFTVSAGTLKVQADMSTQGRLNLSGSGKIEVGRDASFKASQP